MTVQVGASAPRHPVAILNPVAKGYPRVVSRVHERAHVWGWPRVEVLHTTADDFGTSQAREALAHGADLVLVGGGDGTVRAVADVLRGTGVGMGIIALGTANLYARNLGLPVHDLAGAVDVAMLGRRAELDLGTARFRTGAVPDRWSTEHLFLVLAGLGNDADTVLDTRASLKRHLGWMAYFESGARHLVGASFSLEVLVDAQPPRTAQLWSYLVGNCEAIPGGIQIFPGAMLDDGLLRTMEVQVTRVAQWLPIAVRGLSTRRAVAPGLVHGTASRVVLRPGQPVALQLDGDVFGTVVEVEIGVQSRSLGVNLPASTLRRRVLGLRRPGMPRRRVRR